MPHGAAPLRRARLRTAVLAGGLAAGLLGRVGDDGVRWLGVRGPTCPLGACLGPLLCPGCGLARSTAQALQGDWSAAVAAHPAGPAVALLLLGALALHLDILRRGHECARDQLLRRRGRQTLAVAIAAGWLLRLCLH